jgi:signal transduction histidine kinase
MFFERMPMVIAVLDRDMRFLRYNTTCIDFTRIYAPLTANKLLPGSSYFDVYPGTEKAILPLFEKTLAGENVQQEAVILETAGLYSYWDLVLMPIYQNGQVVGILYTSSDATDRVSAMKALERTLVEYKHSQEELQRAYQTLEQSVDERTRQLTTLLELSYNIASTIELEPQLGLILDQLASVVEYDGASIFRLEDNILTVVAYRGPIPQEIALAVQYPLDFARANKMVIDTRTPIIIYDTHDDTPMARAFQATAGDQLDTTFGYIRSWMGVPLIVRDQVIGMLSLDSPIPNYYTQPHSKLVLAFANQVAAAIENARLYQEEQERRLEADRRREVAEGLRDILNILNSNRPLDEILQNIVRQAMRLAESDAATIFRNNPEGTALEAEAAYAQQHQQDITKLIQPLRNPSSGPQLNRNPFAINDISLFLAEKDPSSLEDGSPPHPWLVKIGRHFNAYLNIPLLIRDEVYGSLGLFYKHTRQFSEEEIDLALAFSDQAALAIENARLRAQAERTAVAAERTRLARDLHDAVTQTLFSASLIAEVLPRLWERKPQEAQLRLEELRQLTRGALAEMRTLLLELRPAALAEADLGELFRHLTEAFSSRAQVPVEFSIQGSLDLSAEVKVALYRITQEALNNIAKHAAADHAALRIVCTKDTVALTIQDDGCGFNPAFVTPDHLGLGIMRERAESIQAKLQIDSQPDAGTTIVVTWPGA